MTKAQNIADHINEAIKQQSVVVRAHDHVHPDRNECGGVGGCALMMSEHDTEVELIRAFTAASREGYIAGVSLMPRRG
jgi:hypothetical protein